MPPKERLTTKSWTFPINDPLSTPVQFVKGVGPVLARRFAQKNIYVVSDLFFFFPRTYEDRKTFQKVYFLKPGQKATLELWIRDIHKKRLRNGKSILQATAYDDTGFVQLTWFRTYSGLETFLKTQKHLFITGVLKKTKWGATISHPQIHQHSFSFGKIVPIYSEIDGIKNTQLQKIIFEAWKKFAPSFLLKEDLPSWILKKHQLPTFSKALEEIHFPKTSLLKNLLEKNTLAYQRLIYEEFFKFLFIVLKNKKKRQRAQSMSFPLKETKKTVDFLKSKLPFTLTQDQEKTLQTLLKDLSQPFPMNRLLQGDVGAGKTVVALLTLFSVLTQGSHGAFLVPTEVLAQQHFQTIQKLFSSLPSLSHIPIRLLTSKTKPSERKSITKLAKSNTSLLVIGTHAILEDYLKFSSLDMIVIDEQHRFGVEQRKKLRMKGTRKNGATTLHPHTMVMTATPIPRSLALTFYGDLQYSAIHTLPPGRKPVQTWVIPFYQRKKVFQKILQELKKKKQVYFIYPLIEEGENTSHKLKAAMTQAAFLQKEIFPNFQVGLLHGQMKSQEKEQVMQKFYQNQIHILVSTTVIEVGVDVPNATIMVIENAERFGLSQLHQLRGRVGRNQEQSFCFLFPSDKISTQAWERLRTLETCQDGFQLAEIDLKLRGPGEFLGTRQAGGLPFYLADLSRDTELLQKAREDCLLILEKDPLLKHPSHSKIRNFFFQKGKELEQNYKTL